MRFACCARTGMDVVGPSRVDVEQSNWCRCVRRLFAEQAANLSRPVRSAQALDDDGGVAPRHFRDCGRERAVRTRTGNRWLSGRLFRSHGSGGTISVAPKPVVTSCGFLDKSLGSQNGADVRKSKQDVGEVVQQLVDDAALNLPNGPCCARVRGVISASIDSFHLRAGHEFVQLLSCCG